MKIYYISDIHYEFENQFNLYIDKSYLDSYLILAGDICSYHETEKFTQFFDIITTKFKEIIYVPGNHEYYKSTLNDSPIRELCNKYPNVHFLQDEYIILEDVTFYGSTLWTRGDANKYINYMSEQYVNDYKYIKKNIDYSKEEPKYIKNRTITREETAELHESKFKLLKEFVTKQKHNKLVVVTHHLPLLELVHDKFKDYKYISCYASNLIDEITQLNIDYWVYGHTHCPKDYKLVNSDNKEIKFLCNPRGYLLKDKYENGLFNEEMYFEL